MRTTHGEIVENASETPPPHLTQPSSYKTVHTVRCSANLNIMLSTTCFTFFQAFTDNFVFYLVAKMQVNTFGFLFELLW